MKTLISRLISIVCTLGISMQVLATGICNPLILTPADADAGMQRLYQTFLQVDILFNNSNAGLDPSVVGTLGYYADRTETVALGPFVTIGSLSPGAVAVQGIMGSSNLQSIFEGGLKQAYGPRTKLVHGVPTVSSIVDFISRRVTVDSVADVYDVNNIFKARIKGVAQYYVPCTGVPTIDWIFFTIQAAGPNYVPEDHYLPNPNH